MTYTAHKRLKPARQNNATSLHSLWLVLILLPLMFLVSAVFFAIYSLFSNTEIAHLDQPIPIALSIVISLLISYGIILTLARKFLPQTSLIVTQLLLLRRQSTKVVLFWSVIGVALGVGCALFFNALSQQFPPEEAFQSSMSSALRFQGAPFYLTFFSAVVVAPIAEEVLFRGFVFTDIHQRVIAKKS